MKKIYFLAAALALLCAAFLFMRYSARYDAGERGTARTATTVTLGDRSFKAKVSDDLESRAKGLSGSDPLREDQAMLFAFPNPGMWGIWMKDMRFPIDILWLDRDLKVVSFEKSVSPETYPDTFFPKRASLYVIELPAGMIDAIGISEGDAASFSQTPPVGK